MNLLIVDDEPMLIDGIMKGVRWELLDFEKVLIARNYEQATAVLSSERVDVLLTDIEMGGKNGLDLIEWVNRTNEDTQCIVLSCHDEFSFAQRAIRLDCYDFVLKPIPYEALTQLLSRAQQRVLEAHGQSVLEDYGKTYIRNMRGETSDSASEGIVETVVSYIKTHIDEDMPIELLAKQANISPRHLARLFQRDMGKPIGEFITEQRMQLACELLRDPAISVTLVADRVGYNNYSYFIRLFKRTNGVTPGEYQRRSAQLVVGA